MSGVARRLSESCGCKLVVRSELHCTRLFLPRSSPPVYILPTEYVYTSKMRSKGKAWSIILIPRSLALAARGSGLGLLRSDYRCRLRIIAQKLEYWQLASDSRLENPKTGIWLTACCTGPWTADGRAGDYGDTVPFSDSFCLPRSRSLFVLVPAAKIRRLYVWDQP